MKKVLFPSITPYNTSYLQVSDIHKLWYGQYGNPKGVPVIWLHGGPGAGCSDDNARYFDPDYYRIILLDQRGAGKSKPFCETRENSTQYLVDDMEKLRLHLGLEKWVILGGSWGSALALVYTILHPKNVIGLILRGVYTATKKEIKHIWYDMRDTFPDAWQELYEFLPENERADLFNSYYARITNSDPKIHLPAIKAFTKYDTICAYLHITPGALEECYNNTVEMVGLAKIFMHYCANSFFLEENYIINNIDKISHVPGIIVHGRYDIATAL